MRLLLDTHVFAWWMLADRRLRSTAREILLSPDHDIAVSAATFWELEIKRGLNRAGIDFPRLEDSARREGFEELPIRIVHSRFLQRLPLRHRDPFDRMLIAQSIAEGRALLTRDRHILAYEGIEGFAPIRV